MIKLLYALFKDFILQIKVRGLYEAFQLLVINIRSVLCKNPEPFFLEKHRLNKILLDRIISPMETTEVQVSKIEKYRIWVLWWQGEDQMPSLVRSTYNSICKSTDKEVVLITQKNWKNYIKPEQWIEEKVNKRIIKLPALSDYIRASLLYQYGGLWIDSTMLITKDIPAFIYECDFFSIHDCYPQTNKYVAKGRWNVQVLGSNKCHLDIFKYMLHIFTEYWKENNYIMDYLLVDYAIDYAYSHNNKVKQLVDKLPVTNKNMHVLRAIINKPFEQNYWDELNNDSWMFKLTYKDTFIDKIENVNTYYSYIKSVY